MLELLASLSALFAFGFWVVVWIACGLIAAIIAQNRSDNGCLWFLIALILGPLSLVLILLVEGKRCPNCRSKIHSQARVCPKCQRDLPVPATGVFGKRERSVSTRVTMAIAYFFGGVIAMGLLHPHIGQTNAEIIAFVGIIAALVSLVKR